MLRIVGRLFLMKAPQRAFPAIYYMTFRLDVDFWLRQEIVFTTGARRGYAAGQYTPLPQLVEVVMRKEGASAVNLVFLGMHVTVSSIPTFLDAARRFPFA